MPIDAGELGLEAVFFAIIGTILGVLVGGLLVAGAVDRLGGRRFGFVSLVLAVAISIAVVVDVIVLGRVLQREVTGWDLVWAVMLSVAAGVCAWRLSRASV